MFGFSDANLRRSSMGSRMLLTLVIPSVPMQGWLMPTNVEGEGVRWVKLTFILGTHSLLRCPYDVASLIKPPHSHEGLMLDYETALTCEMDVPSAVLSESSTGMRIFFFPLEAL